MSERSLTLSDVADFYLNVHVLLNKRTCKNAALHWTTVNCWALRGYESKCEYVSVLLKSVVNNLSFRIKALHQKGMLDPNSKSPDFKACMFILLFRSFTIVTLCLTWRGLAVCFLYWRMQQRKVRIKYLKVNSEFLSKFLAQCIRFVWHYKAFHLTLAPQEV